MIQYPKQVHVTLPSVESWGTSMNILRDPPKAIWTRKIDKVSQTQEITRLIGEDNGDRICEMIKVYPRGINPHVAVSYSNYGTNGGQNRQTTLAGVMGRNKACYDGRSALTGQARLPYAVIDNGAFRPPLFRQEDLVPLSRLPRTITTAWTQPGFVNYAQARQCKKPENMREISNRVKTNIRPTATITVQKPLVEPFEIRQVIENPIRTSVSSGIRSIDVTQKNNSDINGRIQERLNGNIRTNLSQPSRGGNIVKDLNEDNYLAEARYSNVTINKGKHGIQLVEPIQKDLPVKDTMINYSTTSGFSRPNADPLKDNIPYELSKVIPAHDYTINKTSNIHIKNTDPRKIQLTRNRPIARVSSSTGMGLGADCYTGGSRIKKLKLKTRPLEGFAGKTTIPLRSLERNTDFRTNENKMNILQKVKESQILRAY